MTFMEKLKSRKLLVLIGSIITGGFLPGLIPLLTILAPTYIGAQGVADAAANLAKKIKDA